MHTLALGLVLLVLALAVACDPGLPSSSNGAAGSSSATGFVSSSSSGGGAPASAGSGWPGYGGGGVGGASGAGVATSASSTAATSVAGSGSAGGTGGGDSGGSPSSDGGGACAIGHLVIGEVRTRGVGGASDEFVALFNASGSAVTLDASFELMVRGATDTTFRSHWAGAGGVIPPFGHYLVGGSAYAEAPLPDAHLTTAIPDAAAIRLTEAGATVDELCFGYNDATMTAYDASFTCPGVASNLPHDDTSSAGSDVDASLARRPGGALGNCVDTGSAANDFINEKPATPESSASSATP